MSERQLAKLRTETLLRWWIMYGSTPVSRFEALSPSTPYPYSEMAKVLYYEMASGYEYIAMEWVEPFGSVFKLSPCGLARLRQIEKKATSKESNDDSK